MAEQEKDGLVFEDLYERYKDISFKRALILLNNNKYDAEEAFQQAWASIAQNINGIKSRDERVIASYIMKTVAYKAILVAKANIKWKKGTDMLIIDSEEYIYDDFMYEIYSKESYDTIIEIMENMDEVYRDVIMFTYIKGLSVKEIAERLCMNESTVWSKFYRGREILMSKLSEKGFGRKGNEKTSGQ